MCTVESRTTTAIPRLAVDIVDIHGWISRFRSYPWTLWISISKLNFDKYFKQCVRPSLPSKGHKKMLLRVIPILMDFE